MAHQPLHAANGDAVLWPHDGVERRGNFYLRQNRSATEPTLQFRFIVGGSLEEVFYNRASHDAANNRTLGRRSQEAGVDYSEDVHARLREALSETRLSQSIRSHPSSLFASHRGCVNNENRDVHTRRCDRL